MKKDMKRGLKKVYGPYLLKRSPCKKADIKEAKKSHNGPSEAPSARYSNGAATQSWQSLTPTDVGTRTPQGKDGRIASTDGRGLE